MRSPIIAATLAAVVALGACQKTADGDLEVQTPDVDISADRDTINTPNVGTTTDTINTPVVGTEKDTVVVTKPVVGTEKREVQRPTTRP